MTEYAKSFEIIKSDDLQQAKARAKMSAKKKRCLWCQCRTMKKIIK